MALRKTSLSSWFEKVKAKIYQEFPKDTKCKHRWLFLVLKCHSFWQLKTRAVRAIAGYTLCFGRTSVYLIMSLIAPYKTITVQHRRICIHLSVSLSNDLGDPGFDCVGLPGFKNMEMLFNWPKLFAPYLSLTVSLSLLYFFWLVLLG